MSRKPETTFIGSVHKHLPKKPHREKNNNPYSSGTADVWYSGNSHDLWVEYKFIIKLPSHGTTLIKADLSALQAKWLDERYDEGRNIAVVIGCPEGGIILREKSWLKPITQEQFKRHLLTRKELAEWITEQTMRN